MRGVDVLCHLGGSASFTALFGVESLLCDRMLAIRGSGGRHRTIEAKVGQESTKSVASCCFDASTGKLKSLCGRGNIRYERRVHRMQGWYVTYML